MRSVVLRCKHHVGLNCVFYVLIMTDCKQLTNMNYLDAYDINDYIT